MEFNALKNNYIVPPPVAECLLSDSSCAIVRYTSYLAVVHSCFMAPPYKRLRSDSSLANRYNLNKIQNSFLAITA